MSATHVRSNHSLIWNAERLPRSIHSDISCNLPAIIGPLIRPIVTSTAKESMTRTLASVRVRFVH